MSETLVGIIVGAVVALGGVVIQQWFSSRREERQRQWAVEDARRARRQQVVDKRCEQIERYIEGVTVEVQLLHVLGTKLLWAQDQHHVDLLREDYERRSDRRDDRIQAAGHAIATLNDEQLSNCWDAAEQQYDELLKQVNLLHTMNLRNADTYDAASIRVELDEIRMHFDKACEQTLGQINRILTSVA